MDNNLALEGQPPSTSTIRRSYQSSGYGGNVNDYSGGQSYGGQSGQQQQYGGQQQQMGGTIGRQFDPMFPPGGGGGGGYSGMSGFGMGASGYYPSGFGLENRFLSLFPRRSSFYQPYYPYGPFGAGGSLFPGAGGGPFGGGGGLFGTGGGGGQYGGGGYPGMGMGMGGGGGGLGNAFGALGRLAQASSLLTGGLQSYRERLQPGSMLGSMTSAAAAAQSAPPLMHHYSGEMEGTS
ncbi:PREDICTED: keratin, type II cytoskeletal 1-like [Rhagoletis zephyria]|uniref:keratin, type II cytoskeletal 1-like n=1 Tax=Rhagoletis zephyria TaxID=28612 RepID=UPI00081185E4|nr:PREDICTED: keratin, type II cytoskeletal 1-like [Rhagoletis zephyria]